MLFLAAFHFSLFLGFLTWGVLAILNYWVWSKTKAKGNLIMLCGAAAVALANIITTFSTFPGEFVLLWLPTLGAIAFTAGFFLSVKPLVEAQLASLKKKMESLKEATAEKADEATADKPAEDSGTAS